MIIVSIYFVYNRTLRLVGAFFSLKLTGSHYTKQFIFSTGGAFSHGASVHVLQLHLTKFRILSSPGSICLWLAYFEHILAVVSLILAFLFVYEIKACTIVKSSTHSMMCSASVTYCSCMNEE